MPPKIDKTQSYEDIISHVKAHTPEGKILLSFSGGKDAWGTWFSVRDHFDVYPFYYYMVPGLELVEEYLTYCEKIIGRHIVRLPNPMFYAALNDNVFQPPDRWPIIQRLNLPKITFDDVARAAEESFKLPPMCYTAVGVRSADSARRAMAMRIHGVINEKRKVFYPIWDWKKDRLVDELVKNNIRLSKEYLLFGRSFDGIFLLYLYQLKKHCPKDYQKVLDWFPLADLEIFKYERHLARQAEIQP